MSNKEPQITEEEMQRALGTLPKYEVSVECKKVVMSFAKVYVTAENEEAAKVRAAALIKSGDQDDTSQPISWADNQDSITGKPKVDNVRFIAEDDYMAHRFTDKTDPDADDLDEGFSMDGKIII